MNNPPGLFRSSVHQPFRDTIPTGITVSLLFGDTVMKVALISWTVALGIALMVAGRSIEQILLSGKIALIGFVLGFVGAKVSDALTAYRKTRSVTANHRR